MDDWQFACDTLKERGAIILESGQWTDCTFLVGGDHEKAEFRAHKLLLSMATPVFDVMLNGFIAEKNVIDIPDVRPDAFKAMLKYIYTGQTLFTVYNDAIDLYYCGKKYMLPYLTKRCIDYLRNPSVRTNKNVCYLFEFAVMFEERQLLQDCVSMIQDNIMAVLKEPSFLKINTTAVKKILNLDHLCITSELDLYHAVENYAINAIKNNARSEVMIKKIFQSDGDQISNPSHENNGSSKLYKPSEKQLPTDDGICGDNKDEQLDDSDDEQEVSRETFRTLIPCIRLLTLTPKEFGDHVANSVYITTAEKYALLLNIVTRKSSIPVPDGFNTSRQLRQAIKRPKW